MIRDVGRPRREWGERRGEKVITGGLSVFARGMAILFITTHQQAHTSGPHSRAYQWPSSMSEIMPVSAPHCSHKRGQRKERKRTQTRERVRG